MSSFKLILPFLLQFFMGHNNQNANTSQLELLNMVSAVVKKEISNMILKIAAGLVATGILLYSLINLFQYLHAYMLLWQNGPAFAVIFFAGLAAVTTYIIYALFNNNQKPREIFESNPKGLKESFSMDKLYTQFLNGLAEGAQEFHKEKAQHYERAARESSEVPNHEYPQEYASRQTGIA